jgi:hypothetical protein
VDVEGAAAVVADDPLADVLGPDPELSAAVRAGVVEIVCHTRNELQGGEDSTTGPNRVGWV